MVNKRTHTCGQLRITEDKKKVVLIGWALRIRDHGGKKFIDLRDREGFTQVVFDPEVTKNFKEVEAIRREYVLEIQGTVRPRPEGTKNPNMATGEVEVLVSEYTVINKCDVLPFDLESANDEISEELRLEYRYLDLRRPEMYNALKNRHRFISAMKRYLDSQEFIEVETPFLIKSTPEGARDMLVPSRKHPGTMYALPQSPQLFKQLLMIAGFERYYQLARCFRDEDSRKDRQLEFTQMDIEVAFVEFEEFRQIMQGALIESFKVYGKNITHADFKSITYQEAIDKYASDKPDLRIQGLEMTNISNIAAKCNFAVFKGVVERGGIVKGMRVEQGQKAYTRNDIDKLVTFCQEQGSKGMAWMKVDETTMEGSITKFFSAEELTAIRTAFKAQTGDYLFFIAGEEEHTNDVLNALRRKVAADLKRVDESKIAFAWITDFRLFKWSSEENKLDFEHSPFTMPNEEATQFIDTKIINVTEDVIKYKKELLALKADCYDLAMNGIEICSGAKRIYRPDLQAKVFEMIAMPKERIEAQFGWFIKAYNYGAPYHRGLAFGVDRIVMLLENKSSIRDVIAFPKNKVGYCPLTHSPSDVDDKQMKELHIKFDIKEEKKN